MSSGGIFGAASNYRFDSSWHTLWCLGTPFQLLLHFTITAWEWSWWYVDQ